MIANLRVGFCERQQNRLIEAIEVRPLAKKQKTSGEKGSSSKLVVIPSLALISPSLLISKVKGVESIPFHKLREKVTISGNDFTPNTQLPSAAHVDAPSQEELDILLKRFPIFINMELPLSHMNKLFLVLERILVDVTADP
ncbi:hypothetical protein PVL29_020960 [Vitis rotundifolia]|uniref:Uncharacterized protein n=1 Tax=Vitis rotundifolia TaxID=103349 RepID=A0AA38YYP3_VITRO|nr:hypothetical protein PVL29_020960 [Vitis rotundifolia]